MRRISVFCGSNHGLRPAYAEAATALGRELALRGIGLVYGGAGVGLMGEVADAALAAGGEVIGVIPRGLVEKEIAHRDLADLRVVASMHERKAQMAALSDAFVALPGGLGTLDELFEALTWSQLGIHSKPGGLLDVCGYYRHLVALLEHGAGEGFLHPQHLALLTVADTPVALLEAFAAYRAPCVEKWDSRPAP